MNLNSPDLPAADEAPVSLQSLHQAYQNLRTLFQALALIVLVLSGSVNVFLLRQVSLVRKEVQERQRFMDDYTQNNLPLITNFVARLQGFARNNPDFIPVMNRYGIRTDNASGMPGTGPAAPGTPSSR
jgi:hypothetical protein